MGADVSLSRRVAAFPHDGGVLYAAIERTYDLKDGLAGHVSRSVRSVHSMPVWNGSLWRCLLS